MTLTDTEAAALQSDVQDLQARVADIETHPPDSFAPINTYYITKTGKTAVTTPEKIEGLGLIGLLQALSPPTVPAETNRPVGIAVSPDGKNVYVAAESGDLVVYARDVETGLLTKQALLHPLGEECRYVAITPNGLNVYVTDAKQKVFVLARNPVDGELTLIQAIKAEGHPQGIAISPDEENVYVADLELIQQYERSVVTGELTLIVRAGNAERQVAISPDGEHLYSTMQELKAVECFNRLPSGELENFATVKTEKEAEAFGILISPDGKNVYVAAINGEELLFQYSRDLETGVLTPLIPAHIKGGAGEHTANLAINPNGTTVFLSGVGGVINQFSRETRTGPLRELKDHYSEPAEEPHGVAVSPDGVNVYVANATKNDVQMYALD